MDPKIATIDDGGPAFPHPTECSDGRGIPHLGMTLRDYFAAKAMQGIIAHNGLSGHVPCQCHTPQQSSIYQVADGHEMDEQFINASEAIVAYEVADAMLAARRPRHDHHQRERTRMIRIAPKWILLLTALAPRAYAGEPHPSNAIALDPHVERIDALHVRLSGAAYWRIETNGTPPWVNPRFLDSIVYTSTIKARNPTAPWLPTPDSVIQRFWLAGEMVMTLEPGKSYSISWMDSDSIHDTTGGSVRMVGLAADANLDGGVSVADLSLFTGWFAAGDLRADLDDGSGTGTHDGGVGTEDLIYFLRAFDAGGNPPTLPPMPPPPPKTPG